MDVLGKTASEKRLIDANALKSYMDECSKETRFRVYYGYATSFIDAAPTVDAVEVVRCRECKHHKDTSVKEHAHCSLTGYTVEYDDFCSCGERKDFSE